MISTLDELDLICLVLFSRKLFLLNSRVAIERGHCPQQSDVSKCVKKRCAHIKQPIFRNLLFITLLETGSSRPYTT
jgi:hypothetical protein